MTRAHLAACRRTRERRERATAAVGELLRREGARVVDLRTRVARALRMALAVHARALGALSRQAASVAPRAVMKRGYVLLRDPRGGVYRGVGELRPGDQCRVEGHDGTIDVVVKRPCRTRA